MRDDLLYTTKSHSQEEGRGARLRKKRKGELTRRKREDHCLVAGNATSRSAELSSP